VFAAELPSLFRGVVVADSPLGVRVVSVEETAQAFFAYLRPEDLVVRVGETDIRSIDEFAALSMALKGKAVAQPVVIFRNGAPRTLRLHLYSFPILREWRVEFVPNYDFRFAELSVGRDYWRGLGRGFEEAGKPPQALDAYMNALHHVPADGELGMKAAVLFAERGGASVRARALGPGLAALHDGLLMMDRLFDYPLSDDQLRLIRDQLHATLEALRAAQSPTTRV